MIEAPVHPAADLFPMLGEDALTALENDIKVNGQHAPILLWDGRIVDGRNRYAACVRADIKPKTKAVSFADEAECIRFIISTNIHRRHLTVEQRADIADELAKLRPGDNQHTREAASKEATSPVLSQEEAAKAMGVSRTTVQRIHAVKADAPDLAAKVKSGEIKVSKAAQMARERTRPSEPVADPDLASDVVADAESESAAAGYTKRMYARHARIVQLDATEITAHIELLRKDGYIK